MENVVVVLKRFCKVCIEEKNYIKALSILSPEVMWFGSGSAPMICGIEQAKNCMKNLFDTVQEKMHVNFLKEDCKKIDAHTYQAYVQIQYEAEHILKRGYISAYICREQEEFIIRTLYTDFHTVGQPILGQELELLLEKVECGICVYDILEDKHLKIRYVNDGYCHLCGGTVEEIHKHFAQDPLFGISEQDRNRVYEYFLSIINNHEKGEISCLGKTLDDREIWVTMRLVYAIQADGQESLYITYFNTSKLMQMQEEMSKIVDNIPGAICVYHWQGEKLEPIVVSEQYSEMIGADAYTSLIETKGLAFRHVHPDDLKIVQNNVLEALKTTHKGNCTFRSYNEKKKKYIWINCQGKAVPQPDGSQYVYVVYMDISKDKQNENKLRESQQSLEVAAEHAGLWYWILDIQNGNGYISERAQRDFGLKPYMENFVDNWLENGFISSKYRGCYQKMFEEIQNGRRQAYADCICHTSDGITHWVRFLLNAIKDANGVVERAIGTAQIIDDFKELEEKYEIERNKSKVGSQNIIARGIINLTKRSVMDYNLNGFEIDDVSGKSLKGLVAATAQFIIYPEQREEYLRIHDEDYLLSQYAKGKKEITIDLRCRDLDNKIIWVRNTLHMMRQPRNTDIYLFESCQNINKEKNLDIMMEFAVNDEYDLIGCTCYEDNCAVMLYGRDSFNPYGETLWQDDYTECMHQFANHAVMEEDRQEFIRKADIDNIKSMLEQGTAYEFYFRANKDGKYNNKRIRFIPYGEKNDMCLFIQNDITVLLEEEERKQNELKDALNRAESASHYKTNFLSQMSHEIRTPMNAIMGMAQLAKDAGELGQKDEYIDKIEASSQYLLGIINDILDMSRIESGKFELHPSWICVNDVFGTCIEMLKPAMKKKKLNFIYPDVSHTAKVEYYIDGLRTQQIYMNLLNNALKFTPEGGTVEMRIENIKHDDHSSVDRVTITDTGCGMSKEFLERIFEPFEQEINPYSTLVQGTGLGLALVKQILTAMGGSIQVESELGKGSKFYFDFPYEYRYTKKLESQIKKNQMIDLKGKRILLADDHPLNREIGTKLLEKKGVIVEQACDGEEVVTKYMQSTLNYYDLILMDIRMPKLDGLQATKKIRRLERIDAKDIPIIAMTANAFDDDVKDSFDAGLNAHLTKPIEPQKLYQTIDMWIANAKEE